MASFKELPYVARIGIVTLVILVLAGGAYYVALYPLVKANQSDALILKSRQAEVARLTPFKAKLADLVRESDELKVKMEDQKKIVPEEKEVPSFITMVEHESVAAGVEIRRFTPKDTAKKEYYVEVPIDVDVDGPFYAVLNFYDRLQKMERIVTVSHLSMGSLKAGRSAIKKSYAWSPNETVSANSLMTTFYSIPAGAAAPPVAAKKKK